jgi:tRNA threonylcarbamoyladenosine biosynthesis protein TsaE
LKSQDTLEVVTHSAELTRRLGKQLGRLLRPGQVVALIGELGAGKTCLTQGIASGLGVERPVTSPTFIIVNEYRGGGKLQFYHVDCFRFPAEGSEEALAIGMDEMLHGDPICVIEWADRIEKLLPSDYLRVTLAYVNHRTRQLLFEAFGDQSLDLLTNLENERHDNRQATPDQDRP